MRHLAVFLFACGNREPQKATDSDTETDTDTDSDSDSDSDTDTETGETGESEETGLTETEEPNCWDVVSVESTVCFSLRSDNATTPPEVFATAPSRLVAVGLDSGTQCPVHVWPYQIVGSLDMAIVDGQVNFCESDAINVFTSVDPATGIETIGGECEGSGSTMTAVGSGIAYDTSYQGYGVGGWHLFPALADAIGMMNATPWAGPPPEAAGWDGASLDGDILYVYQWPRGEVEAFDVVTGSLAAIVAPNLPAASYLITGMEALDGEIYMLECDGIDFTLARYDPATGMSIARNTIGSVSNDAYFGLACFHP